MGFIRPQRLRRVSKSRYLLMFNCGFMKLILFSLNFVSLYLKIQEKRQYYLYTFQADSVVVAQITYQSLFQLYPKLSGMTGTAKTEVWTSLWILRCCLTFSNKLVCSLIIFFLMQSFSHLIFSVERVLENVPDASY